MEGEREGGREGGRKGRRRLVGVCCKNDTMRRVVIEKVVMQ